MPRTNKRSTRKKKATKAKKVTPKVKRVLRLNLGCGKNKFPGFVNIDVEATVEPDLVLDFRQKQLPYPSSSIKEVWICHTIEHIEKVYRPFIFTEVNRVLRIGGIFILTFPNFEKCVRNYLKNLHGQREFWEATIYGRQLYPADYHVAAIVPNRLIHELKSFGFAVVYSRPESDQQPFNHLICVEKMYDTITQEDLLKRDN